MKLLKAKLADGKLSLLVDRIPCLKEMVFAERGGIYYGERDGYVMYFRRDPRNRRGFGGLVFWLRMQDGTTRKLCGPWWSRPEEAHAAGFGPCVEASLRTTPDGISYCGAVTLALAREAAALAGCSLRRRRRGAEYWWEPRRRM